MHLMSISFDKHKSFQNKTQVTLAPLTLIFGHNSSGKSTAIEKLNRVKLMQFFEDIEKDRSSLKIPLNASFQYSSFSIEIANLTNLKNQDPLNLKITWTSFKCNPHPLIPFLITLCFTNPKSDKTYSIHFLRKAKVAAVIPERYGKYRKKEKKYITPDYFGDLVTEFGMSAMLENIESGILGQTTELKSFQYEEMLAKKRSHRRGDWFNGADKSLECSDTWRVFNGKYFRQRLNSLDSASRSRPRRSRGDESPLICETCIGKYGLPFLLFDDADEMGILLSHIEPIIVELIKKQGFLGALRERTTSDFIFNTGDIETNYRVAPGKKDVDPIFNYLYGTGEQFWPTYQAILQAAMGEDSNSDAILGKINEYLYYLGIQCALPTPSNTQFFEQEAEDLETFNENYQGLDGLTQAQSAWLAKMPPVALSSVLIWQKKSNMELKWHIGKPTLNNIMLLPNDLRNSFFKNLFRCTNLTLALRKSDELTHQQVPLSQVGSGVSQVLPILMNLSLAAYHQRDQYGLLVTEQPELHLHPKAQADLADIFMDAVTGCGYSKAKEKLEYKVQQIVETHSETFILRIKRRIAEGSFRAEDVAINYVWQDEQGLSHIKHIRLDKHGNFIDSWPHGFFLESYNETLRD